MTAANASAMKSMFNMFLIRSIFIRSYFISFTPGDSVYLLGSGNTVLAAGVMDADTTFTLKGRIAAPELASLSDRYATVEPAMLFLEAGTIRIEPRHGSGYRVTGTRLNDRADSVYRSCAALDARLRDEKLSGGNPETIRAIASERNEVISTAVRANNDNLLGAYLFQQFQSSGTPAGVRERLAEFSPEMRAHPILRVVLTRIEAVEKQLSASHTPTSPCATPKVPLSRCHPLRERRTGFCSTSGRPGVPPAAAKSPTCARHTPPTKPKGSKFTASRSTTTRRNGGRSHRTTTCRGSMSWASTRTNRARRPQPTGSRRSPRTS